MKKSISVIIALAASVLLGACSENLDPLAPGSTDGQFAIGTKALVPIAAGNRWTYRVTLYDTSASVRSTYLYDVAVIDTVFADTSLVPPSLKTQLSYQARLWYRVMGELGKTSFWQIDSLDNFSMRKSDERFSEQLKFNFLAAVGDYTPYRFFGADTIDNAVGDTTKYASDSVRIRLISKGAEAQRTTLGSAPLYTFTQSFKNQPDTIQYYFKPGFGKVLSEEFRQKPDSSGTMYRHRRDELVSYYFR